MQIESNTGEQISKFKCSQRSKRKPCGNITKRNTNAKSTFDKEEKYVSHYGGENRSITKIGR